MEKQSMVSGGKGLALAGSAVAIVLVLLGLVMSGKLAPPDRIVRDEAVTPEQATAPQTAAPQSEAPGSATPEAPVDEAVTDNTPATTAEPEAEVAVETTELPVSGAALPETVAQTEEVVPPAPLAGPATEQDSTAAAPAGDAVPETATADPAPAPTSTAAPAEVAEVLRPSFDTVRLAPDGEAVVAGRSMAGSTVDILLDGVVVGTAMTGGDGAFAAFLSLPPSNGPRVLTLAISKDGTVVPSEQQVIIAPVQKTEVAQAADGSAPDATSPQAIPENQTVAAEPASAPALLLSDTSGVRVLQPATPADPSRIGGIALDVISYTSQGDVLLQGRATVAANVLIYLDNAPVTSALVGADGLWSTGLPGVAPGIYTLRLDEVDAAGKVLSRIETPFKREDRNEVAAIAAASEPAATTPAMPERSSSSGAMPQVTGDQTAAVTQANADGPAPATVRVVTVQPGNTLWAIARESYGEGPLFVRVFEANRDRIRDPDLIYPGQIFEIPE